MLATLRGRRLIWPTVMTGLGVAALVSLGNWQLDRKAWKEDIIARIGARTTAPPVGLAEANDRVRAGGDAEYLRVVARGRFLNDKERYFYAPDPELGPGYHVYTPFEVAGEGAVLFVNRGFVPEALKAPEARKAGQLGGEVEVTGLVRMPGKKGFFTPDNDPKSNLWFWRDFAGLLRSVFADAERATIPLFLEAEAAAPGGWPKGGATRLEIPNRHLEYALTWFGLAAALLAVFAAYAASRARSET
jgi:surfeit locus 1 family protein